MRPGKQRVRVLANAIESTPPKQMRELLLEENTDEN